jgi:hypothetical protein
LDCILLIRLYLDQVAGLEITNFKSEGNKAVHNFICGFFDFYVNFFLKSVDERKIDNGGLVADFLKRKALHLVELLAVPLFQAVNHGVLKKLSAWDVVNLNGLWVVFEDLLKLAEFFDGE